jgi:hypothetical protein
MFTTACHQSLTSANEFIVSIIKYGLTMQHTEQMLPQRNKMCCAPATEFFGVCLPLILLYADYFIQLGLQNLNEWVNIKREQNINNEKRLERTKDILSFFQVSDLTSHWQYTEKRKHNNSEPWKDCRRNKEHAFLHLGFWLWATEWTDITIFTVILTLQSLYPHPFQNWQ